MIAAHSVDGDGDRRVTIHEESPLRNVSWKLLQPPSPRTQRDWPQSRRAERERLVSDITGRIRSVNDPQAMIQTAMEELQRALGASRVEVRCELGPRHPDLRPAESEADERVGAVLERVLQRGVGSCRSLPARPWTARRAPAVATT